MRLFLRFLLVFLLVFYTQPSFAIDEVVLDIDGEVEESNLKDWQVITDDEWYFDMGGKTLKEKILEINSKEINDISKSHYLL